MELVLGKELEDGQWTDRLYVISELAVGNSVILNDALICITRRYVIAAHVVICKLLRCQRSHQLALLNQLS